MAGRPKMPNLRCLIRRRHAVRRCCPKRSGRASTPNTHPAISGVVARAIEAHCDLTGWRGRTQVGAPASEVPGQLARRSGGVEDDPDDRVERDQLDALKPGRLSIRDQYRRD
jgi:hypothetical protein